MKEIFFFALSLGTLSFGAAQRVVDGLVADYSLTQCECNEGTFLSSVEGGPQLTLSGACPTLNQEFFTSLFPSRQGFVVPEEIGALSDSAAGLLNDENFTIEGFFRPGDLNGAAEVAVFDLFSFNDANGAEFLSLEVRFLQDQANLVLNVEGVEFVANSVTAVGLMHFACGLDTTTARLCLNGVCEDLTIDAFPAAELETFQVGSNLNQNVADLFIFPEITTFSVFDLFLSAEDVLLNAQDQTVITNFPVAEEVLLEGTEDENVLFQSTGLTLVDEDGVAVDLATVVLEFSSEGVEIVDGEVTGFLENAFSSADEICDKEEEGDFVLFQLEQIDVEVKGQACTQTVPVRTCLVEVGDEPEAVTEAEDLEVRSFDDQTSFTFVPAVDVDDDETLSLGGQVPIGVLPGGRIEITSIETEGEESLVNVTFFQNEECSENLVVVGSEILIDEDGTCTVCFTPGEEREVTLKFTVLDADGVQSLAESSIIVEFDLDVELNVGGVVATLVIGAVLTIALSTCVIVYFKKRNSDDGGGGGGASPIGNLLGGNLAF